MRADGVSNIKIRLFGNDWTSCFWWLGIIFKNKIEESVKFSNLPYIYIIINKENGLEAYAFFNNKDSIDDSFCH